MNYQNEITKEIKTYQELRAEHTQVSLPRDGCANILGEWIIVKETPKPVYDEDTKGIREISPVNYIQTWEVYELSTAEKKDKKDKKDKKNLDVNWEQYKKDKEEAEKQAWIASGSPLYSVV